MLIGLSGKAGCGKDTTFSFIEAWAKEQGRPVRRDAFADRLKHSAARALGFVGDLDASVAFCNRLKRPDAYVGYFNKSHDVWFGDDAPNLITGREYLQLYGTEAHREIFGYDFWIDAVVKGYDAAELLVVTDVRFPNEAQAIGDQGGEVWEITRPGQPIAENGHASEQPLPSELLNRVLVNAGDLDDLRAMVVASIERSVCV